MCVLNSTFNGALIQCCVVLMFDVQTTFATKKAPSVNKSEILTLPYLLRYYQCTRDHSSPSYSRVVALTPSPPQAPITAASLSHATRGYMKSMYLVKLQKFWFFLTLGFSVPSTGCGNWR